MLRELIEHWLIENDIRFVRGDYSDEIVIAARCSECASNFSYIFVSLFVMHDKVGIYYDRINAADPQLFDKILSNLELCEHYAFAWP